MLSLPLWARKIKKTVGCFPDNLLYIEGISSYIIRDKISLGKLVTLATIGSAGFNYLPMTERAFIMHDSLFR